MHAQIALQLTKQFPDHSTPVTTEGLILLAVMSIIGLMVLWTAHDELSYKHQ